MNNTENTNPWKIIFTWDLFAIEKHITKSYERAVRPPGTRLILKNPEWKYLINKEYRAEQWWFDYRLPGWKVFDDLKSYLVVRDDEEKLVQSVIAGAKLEAKEEAGVDEIKNIKIYSTSYAWASVEWTLYYISGKIASMSQQKLHWDELIHGIEVWFYSKKEIKDMIYRWMIKEERSVAVLIKYLENE